MKVYGSTGGGDDVTAEQTVSFEEMTAIIDTAHSAGHKVAIHSYGPDGARDAIRAGTDTLEHATDLDDATIAELVRKKDWNALAVLFDIQACAIATNNIHDYANHQRSANLLPSRS